MINEPTVMQKTAVNNVLSGDFKRKDGMPDVPAAMRGAGYSKETSTSTKKNLFKCFGVQLYLKRLDDTAKKRWKVSLPDKVMQTYMEGLDATKLYGKDAIEHPDWANRKAFADKFSEFFNWSQAMAAPVGGFNQFNFFAIDEDQRNKFNNNFKGFLQQYYKKPGGNQSVPAGK